MSPYCGPSFKSPLILLTVKPSQTITINPLCLPLSLNCSLLLLNNNNPMPPFITQNQQTISFLERFQPIKSHDTSCSTNQNCRHKFGTKLRHFGSMKFHADFLSYLLKLIDFYDCTLSTNYHNLPMAAFFMEVYLLSQYNNYRYSWVWQKVCLNTAVWGRYGAVPRAISLICVQEGYMWLTLCAPGIQQLYCGQC